eukprot:430197_1
MATTCSFQVLQLKHCGEVVKEVIVPSMATHDAGYIYMFPKEQKSREIICTNVYSSLIHRNTENIKFPFKSYILSLNNNNDRQIIGHILIKPALPKYKNKKGCHYHEPKFVILKWFISVLFNFHILCNSDWFLLWRIFKISVSKKWL